MAVGLSCSQSMRIRWADRARRGAVAVEMALIAPVFFLFLMGTVELCLMWGAQQLMDSATFNVSRLAKTGYDTATLSQAQLVSQELTSELSTYGSLFDMTKVTLTATAYNSFSDASSGNNGTAGYGTQQQIVVYTVSYSWKLFTPMMANIIGDAEGKVPLTSQIVVRNEPYG